jgi:hypothetical protein
MHLSPKVTVFHLHCLHISVSRIQVVCSRLILLDILILPFLSCHLQTALLVDIQCTDVTCCRCANILCFVYDKENKSDKLKVKKTLCIQY